MRNRKMVVAALLCMLVIRLTLPVQASEYRFVFDESGLLTQEEVLRLEDMAANTSVQYGCGVYIVTLWDYTQFGSDVLGAAENYFLAHDFGLGSDDNGVMLLLSMAERDYALIAHGNIGNAAFTDYGKDFLSEDFLDDFSDDDWDDGFEDYLSTSDWILYQHSIGEPVDVEEASGLDIFLMVILPVSAAVAGIVCGIMALLMKTARRKTHADDYRKEVQVTDRHDRFITRTVVRQKIEQSSSSRPSGGGTTVNSRGFSGKSGKF